MQFRNQKVSVDEHAHSVRRNTREIGGAPEVEKNPQFWNNMAKTSIQDALRIQKNHKTKVWHKEQSSLFSSLKSSSKIIFFKY